ncbi:hypothetical protein DSM25558_0645 [Agrobacterium sp. DSM 25558]|nr:hypothetical protein DSM25558_0645 [Agrobacterium sp. DSM 25558]
MVFEIDRFVMPNRGALREKLAAASWRRYLLSAGLVLSLTASGFFLPTMLLEPGLQGYVSQARVKVSNPHATAAGVQRMTSQLGENLLSPMALGLMVSDLKLQPQDLTGMQTPGHLAVFLDLLAGGGENADVLVGATETALKNAVSISSAPSSNEIEIDVTAATPEASQRIADYFAARIVKNIGAEQRDPELQAVERARVALDSAEAALTGFQMRHGNDAVSRIQGLQQKIREDEANAATLSAKSTELADGISAATSMKVADVLNGNLPAMAAFAPLETIRQNYTAAKLALAEVSVDHGPKHPRTIAAQATVDAARATAMPSLRRALEALKQEQITVTEALEVRAANRAELDNQLQALGDAPADLARLEAALEKARTDYIISSDAAGTFSSAPRVSAALAVTAEPGVANYDSFTANAMSVAGGAAGLLIALFVLSFRRKEEANETAELPAVIEPETALDTHVDEMPSHETIEIEPSIFDDLSVEYPATPEPVMAETASSIVVEDEAETEAAYDEAANDIPLDERVRQVLMQNAIARPSQERDVPVFKLPPLLAAALAGQADHAQAETEELRILRQELALLRTRLLEHAREERDRNRA